ncbi:LysR substrate-binding domain-containing protein [Polaromonas sp. CG_9.11]|uniref:LysR substrate-binding domain-containing protein n=1 Tax=Polaromonas sp. CG_9.11 TaxID=2787730 RepID=UPI0018C9C7D3|nr:LysR substrate-binding domain-containing protein [Polaromonas sp. CG_9.11]MBG6076094.1 DNA-binding transcriptional LysR family regulator [Polaromonas sp. CG_9.11]
MSSIRTLKTFVSVATEGSFAAAALKVALTQAAVGLQMRVLEGEMRRPLFERQGKVITLNGTGRELLPKIKHLIAQYEKLLSAAGTETLSGTVNLGAVVSTVRSLVRACLAVRARHPSLDLHISAAKSIELLSKVGSGELDAAVVVRDPGQSGSGLAWTALYSEPMVLVCPRKASEKTVQSGLKSHPFLRFDRTELTGQIVERTLRKLRIKPNEFLELNSIETIVELIRSDLGVSILPLLNGSRWLADPKLQIIEIAQVSEQRHIVLVQSAVNQNAGLTDVLAQEFLSTLKSL